MAGDAVAKDGNNVGSYAIVHYHGGYFPDVGHVHAATRHYDDEGAAVQTCKLPTVCQIS